MFTEAKALVGTTAGCFNPGGRAQSFAWLAILVYLQSVQLITSR